MKCLEELEKKIFVIIQKNNDLQLKIDELLQAKKALEDQNQKYENSLLKENNNTQVLIQEKDVIKSSIEELLETIRSLEATN